MNINGSGKWLFPFVLLCSVLSAADLRIKSEQGRIDVFEGERLVTSFYHAEKWDKPFLYPLKTPSGLVVSRGYPLEPTAGESTDHVWHRGIFYGAELEGGDFWREQERPKTGRIVVQGVPETTSAGGSVSISAVANFVTSTNTALGSMIQEYEIRRSGSSYLIDAIMTLLADKGAALTVRGTEECCLAIRLADEFRQDRGATLRNSEGLTGTEQIWGKQAKWTDYSSARNGRKAGAAIFDHPSNPRHPTYWHARGYGMNAANPVGIGSFTKDRTRDGRLTIPEGRGIAFHYRIVLHDGDADQAGIPSLYEAFTKVEAKSSKL